MSSNLRPAEKWRKEKSIISWPSLFSIFSTILYSYSLFSLLYLGITGQSCPSAFEERYGAPGYGHAPVIDRICSADTDYVLGMFRKTVQAARKSYSRFVSEGIAMGRRPELVGGGLIRSLAGRPLRPSAPHGCG